MTTGSTAFPVSSGDVTQSGLTLTLVTPNDSEDLPTGTVRAFQVRGTAGDVKVTTHEGDEIVVPSVALRERIDLWVKRIWATDTNATGIYTYK